MAIGRRLAMAAVGVGVLAGYAATALLAWWALAALWAARPGPLGSLAAVGVATLVVGYLSYRHGTARLLAGLDAVELPRGRAPWVYRRLETLCARMDVAVPTVLVADLGGPNALSLGGVRDGAIVLDRGLLRLLSGEELAGVLAHELAHLESYDGIVQTLAFTLVRTLAGLVALVVLPAVLVLVGLGKAIAWGAGRPTAWPDTTVGRLRGRLVGGLGAVVLLLTLVVFAHSRRREYAADARAAAVTGRPVALARALDRIRRATAPERGALAPLVIHGDETGRLSRLFSTHPPMADRIERLLERADRSASRRHVEGR